MPILEAFKEWLDKRSQQTPPEGLLGQAINDTLGQWNRLTGYVQDGRLRPDNNLVENAIRPFVLGRKNWLFSGHPRGADAGAALFSLRETAKANDLEPYAYLRHIFEKLPLIADEPEDYRRLLPQHLAPAALKGELNLLQNRHGDLIIRDKIKPQMLVKFFRHHSCLLVWLSVYPSLFHMNVCAQRPQARRTFSSSRRRGCIVAHQDLAPLLFQQCRSSLLAPLSVLPVTI